MAPLNKKRIYIEYSDADREAVKPFQMREVEISFTDEFGSYTLDDDYSRDSSSDLGALLSKYLQDSAAKGEYSPIKLVFCPKEKDMPWQCGKCKWAGKQCELGPSKKFGDFSSWPTCPNCGSVSVGEALWLIRGEEYPQAEMEEWERKQKERNKKDGEVEVKDL